MNEFLRLIRIFWIDFKIKFQFTYYCECDKITLHVLCQVHNGGIVANRASLCQRPGDVYQNLHEL